MSDHIDLHALKTTESLQHPGYLDLLSRIVELLITQFFKSIANPHAVANGLAWTYRAL